MRIRRPLVPIVAFAALAIVLSAEAARSWFVERTHEYDFPLPAPYTPPEPPKPEVIAPTAGDFDLDFSPDSRLLAAVHSKELGGGRGIVDIYRIADHKTVANLGTGADCCAWSPDGTFLAIARTGPARLELWNTATWKLSEAVAVADTDGDHSHGRVIFGGLSVDPMQNVYVVARVESDNAKQTRSHAFVWWNTPNGRSRQLETIGSYPKAEGFSLSASSGTGNETVLAISYVCTQHAADKQEVTLEVLRIWYEGGCRIIRQGEVLFLTDEAWVRVSPDGKTLATLTGPDGAYQWHVLGLGLHFQGFSSQSDPSDNQIDTDEMRYQRIDFSGNRRLALITSIDCEHSSAEFFDLADDRHCSSPRFPSVESTAVGLSPDGHLLAVSAPGRGILVYRLP